MSEGAQPLLLNEDSSYGTSGLKFVKSDETESKEDTSGKLGLFMGVLVPCVLSIFGVILFLRLGMIVGQSGVILSFVMLILGYFIVTLTTLSISAISTNGLVKGGGVYFMLSRSLGPELGGSIGVIFYAANIAATAMYTLGFVEAVTSAFSVFPHGRWWKLLYSTVTLIFCLIVCLVGASFFAKTSFIIFLILMVSVITSFVSFCFQNADPNLKFTSWSWLTFKDNIWPGFQIDPSTGNKMNFRIVFGIVFPACTGIMAGANMSGDLKKPSKAIPKGTLGALLFTLIVYSIFVVTIAFTTERYTLVHDYVVMSDVSYVPILVNIGVFCTTASAALSTLIGASRVLQAFSRDQLLPGLGIFKKGFGRNDEPRISVLFSACIVQLLLLMGKLNEIAPFTSMFFLLSYAFTNFACFLLSVTGAPNFRPLFSYWSWHSALLGSILCFGAMFFIKPLYAAISLLIQLILMILIHYFCNANVMWGDVSQAIIYHQVRKYLLRLDVRKQHVKYWRPQVLQLVSNPDRNWPLIMFMNHFKKGGLFVVGKVILGDIIEHRERYFEEQDSWLELIREGNIKAFPELITSSSFRQGAQNLMMTSGVGGMKVNSVVFGFYRNNQGKRIEDTWLNKTDGELVEVNEENSINTAAKKPKRNNKKKKDPWKPTSMNRFTTETSAGEEGQHHINAPPTKVDSDLDLNLREYISTLGDAILLKKNLILARHFEKLSKDMLSPSGLFLKVSRKKLRYIDVWPIWIGKDNLENAAQSMMLTLQMAYIVHTVPLWNAHHKLRVLSFVVDDQPMNVEDEEEFTPDTVEYAQRRKNEEQANDLVSKERKRLEEILLDLRIRATIHIEHVKPEDFATVLSDIENGGTNYQSVNNTFYARYSSMRDAYESISETEKHQVINSVINRVSSKTSVTFLTLSSPPFAKNAADDNEYQSQCEKYIDDLDYFTEGLPPTLLIHGTSSVVTNEL
eukprot:gb/GECH01014757.1/.p1 GENE.gb/GECH01014757.1/~~gb/GECH01014757.1/.p1  ORF type:complete len:964 (+),score=178.28 gb/GECH01014757.1/:1-2892(+)